MLFLSCIFIPFWFLLLKLLNIMLCFSRFVLREHCKQFSSAADFLYFRCISIYSCFRICVLVHLINLIVQLYFRFILISGFLAIKFGANALSHLNPNPNTNPNLNPYPKLSNPSPVFLVPCH